MRKSIARIRGAGFVLWHGRHMLYHIMVGLLWVWVLRELWNECNWRWLTLAVFGSMLPDIEHFFYVFAHQKSDEYAKLFKELLKSREWRTLTIFIEQGHKYQTELSYHNIYTVIMLFGITLFALLFDWKSWVVLFGAMISHYLFDIIDDVIVLGSVNPNWKRWGDGKRNRKNRRKQFTRDTSVVEVGNKKTF